MSPADEPLRDRFAPPRADWTLPDTPPVPMPWWGAVAIIGGLAALVWGFGLLLAGWAFGWWP